MSILYAAVGAALIAVLIAVCFVHRRRCVRLSGQIEDFLQGRCAPLEFSLRDDYYARLINAVAELQNRVTLSEEHTREERQRTADLTADISHQLKTPLTALRLYCELDEGEHIAQQTAQIERMEVLIRSMLRLERLCADGYAFEFVTRDMADVARRAWLELQDTYTGVECSIEGGASIRCDEGWLREAFINIFKNACAHMQGGRISVNFESGDTAAQCIIEDEGGGVQRDALPHLFERFYRAQSDNSEGSGLGLAITREIITRHHGTISAGNSARGLRICIILPLYYE